MTNNAFDIHFGRLDGKSIRMFNAYFHILFEIDVFRI